MAYPTIITRAGKGSPLTNNEVDGNFTGLLQASPPLPVVGDVGKALIAKDLGGGIIAWGVGFVPANAAGQDFRPGDVFARNVFATTDLGAWGPNGSLSLFVGPPPADGLPVPAAKRFGFKTETAEAAGNVGSDLYLQSFDNAGAWLANTLIVNRKTNAVAFPGGSVSTGPGNELQLLVWPGNYTRISFDYPNDTGLQWSVPREAWEFFYKGSAAKVAISKDGHLNVVGEVRQMGAHYFAANGLAPANYRAGVYIGGAETGGNVGSDFTINTYDDAGVFLGMPLKIRRSDGRATFTSALTVFKALAGDASGFVSIFGGDATHTGYFSFHQADNFQAGYFGYADPTFKIIQFAAGAGYNYRFTSALPQGPGGFSLGFAKKVVRYADAGTWVDVATNDGALVAMPGCTFVVVTTTTTQPGLIDGMHWEVVNHSQAPMTINQEVGTTLYWMSPTGPVTGNRVVAPIGSVEILYVGGVYMLRGAGIT